ncbi:MAG: hypothetical protein ACAH06_03355 [Methylophilaceae bacterium]|jgi:hypothetical protein|uniref:hypothetical protein n=1 Tax=Methylobacillus sp. MM3 TaxID=1848039 RepID=UPI0007DE5584|nr:hypothetical protein [Methylobacillus sp. MM3]OAJ71136.1 hypothetical protein A7976_06780 [Methylobacillus sp. MM3]
MSKDHFLHLQHSETVVAGMAATLLAAYIQKGDLNEQNEDVLIEKSIALSIKLAACTDKLVKSDEEWVKKGNDSAYLLG